MDLGDGFAPLRQESRHIIIDQVTGDHLSARPGRTIFPIASPLRERLVHDALRSEFDVVGIEQLLYPLDNFLVGGVKQFEMSGERPIFLP